MRLKHFLHACLDYVAEAQRSCLPMRAVEDAYLGVCLETTLSVLGCSFRKTVFSDQKTQVEGEEARRLLWAGSQGMES